MKLVFIDKREITDVSQLTEIQKRQLEEVATKYDRNYLSAEILENLAGLVKKADELDDVFVNNFSVKNTHLSKAI
ncbi:hypothetical protein [Aquimarina algiphila]|uniref:hypothetical protein n=1 Tax=Aquimarina algiphila TaxID=2047982 RepID=UPI00232B8BE2|nr:hypothetical protein [Aquimarina algiphila]